MAQRLVYPKDQAEYETWQTSLHSLHHQTDELCDERIHVPAKHYERAAIIRQSSQTLDDAGLTVLESRIFGSILSLIVGDALGAPLEFASVRYPDSRKQWGKKNKHTKLQTPDELKDMDSPTIRAHWNRFQLKPGQWTDDASMALCMLDSMLINNRLNCKDLRFRFLLWWHDGYNNAFATDMQRMAGRRSIGLGGTISGALQECGSAPPRDATAAGSEHSSGNGSLMRLAPVPLYFVAQGAGIEQCMQASADSSRTTHQGVEAAECCRLLAFLLYQACHSELQDAAELRVWLLTTAISEFISSRYSVQCMAQSKGEEKHADNAHLELKSRNWNWRVKQYKYAEDRAFNQPGYVGSYAMDGLCMALNCVWTTTSLDQAMLKAANLCGDADTVCAITAQLAGCIYGIAALPPDWLESCLQWDETNHILARCCWLVDRQTTGMRSVVEDGVVTLV
eukprot:m.51217 g.51217  ORF g.51217 m.51217 type:complete len:452 (-) comp13447_c0_seq30:117-1472(-)